MDYIILGAPQFRIECITAMLLFWSRMFKTCGALALIVSRWVIFGSCSSFFLCTAPSVSSNIRETIYDAERFGRVWEYIGATLRGLIVLGAVYSIPGSCMNMPHVSNIFRLYWYGSDTRYIQIRSLSQRINVAIEFLTRLLVLGVFAVSIWTGNEEDGRL